MIPRSRKVVFGWTREEFVEEGETIIENVETDKGGCYVEPALLGRNLINSLGKAKFFTTLDLAVGYWQVEVKEEDRDKTAFTTARGQFRLKVLPFGFIYNSPSTFQRKMDQTLRGLLHKNCLVYLDDIKIYIETFEDHLIHLRQVFERLRKANLKLKPEKCYIKRRQVKYLGHVVSETGMKPDPENVNKVQYRSSYRTAWSSVQLGHRTTKPFAPGQWHLVLNCYKIFFFLTKKKNLNAFFIQKL